MPMYKLLLVAACCAGPALTQPRPETPPPGDPEVAFAFFHFQDDLSREIEKRRADDPAAGEPLERAALALLGVGSADFAKTTLVSRSVKADLGTLHAEAVAYKDKVVASKRTPALKVLQEFEARRRQILTTGMARLKATLSPAGWTALSQYLDGEYRQGILRGPLIPAK